MSDQHSSEIPDFSPLREWAERYRDAQPSALEQHRQALCLALFDERDRLRRELRQLALTADYVLYPPGSPCPEDDMAVFRADLDRLATEALKEVGQ